MHTIKDGFMVSLLLLLPPNVMLCMYGWMMIVKSVSITTLLEFKDVGR